MKNGLMLEVPVNSINFSKNYRQTFPEKSLKELAQSIRQHGVIEPLIVTRRGDGFELVAGDRRLRAASIAGLVTVPARIVEVSDAEVLEIQPVENVQREAVPFFEEALALKRLQDEPYFYDTREIARKIGKSEQYVYFQLKLTRACLELRRACEAGELTKSVAWRLSREPENIQANAARALRRPDKSKLISDRSARQYLDDLKAGRFDEHRAHSLGGMNFNDKPRPARSKKFYSADASDYEMNWKQYLMNFTADQFVEWKSEIAGKLDTSVWAKAVDAVMTRSEAN